MPSKINTVTTQEEILNRIEGYVESMSRSRADHGPNSSGVHTSLGFVRSQINRYFELAAQLKP